MVQTDGSGDERPGIDRSGGVLLNGSGQTR
jgi:hypothetical protein